jgi:uncharacterized Ntn-hydrolase superfamily protein
MKRNLLGWLVLLVTVTAIAGSRLADPPKDRLVCTFSVVGYDPEKKEWGIAVASRVLAVGSIVPWAEANAGAVATQSFANVTYGPRGLKLLADGKSAQEVIGALTGDDQMRAQRQVGIVDSKGESATFTGNQCRAWAGGRSGKYFACQGNILAGPEVVDEMAKAFEGAKGPLAWRLFNALEAGDKAGGDKRGKQSAAIFVVREKGGYAGMNDRMIDLRVDDHKEPVEELGRILSLRLPRPADADKK